MAAGIPKHPRVQAYVPRATHERLKAEADRRGISLSDLGSIALSEFLLRLDLSQGNQPKLTGDYSSDFPILQQLMEKFEATAP